MEQITRITTDEKQKEYWKETRLAAEIVEDCMHVVNVYPDVTYQQFKGFGGAFTEASAHNYMQMGEANRKQVVKDYFSNEGLRYNFGRVHMNSCDFGLGNYSYVEEGDGELKSFDISHDFKEIIPFVQKAQEVAEEPIRFLMSPWSPPAFMKTNGEMNHGGSLKKEYYESWANYFVKFIRAYAEAGIQIGYLTVQNEPMAVQTWDSCVYTSDEERDFVENYLGPKLEEAGLDVKIFVWDHNKEEAYQRFKEVTATGKASDYIAGAAVHWYTGDHFEAIELIHKQYPDKEIFFTEGCVEYSRFADSGETYKAEMYGHDIMGNLNAGIHASLDWNLILDEKGGPNHVGNFCAAPIMFDTQADTYEKRLTYYYIGQFSRYIKRGAVRVGTTRYTDKIEVTGFVNPDGERVIVMLNKTDEEVPVTLREKKCGIETVLKAHSVSTFCYK